MHRSRQQCLVAEWSGLSFTARVRVRARTREWDFSTLLFFLSVLKVTNIFVLHVNRSYDIHGVRATPVRDVTMM